MCKCIICGKENYPIDTKKFPKDFCSYKCYEEWQKFNKTPNCTCSICGRSMYLKPSRLSRVKNGITCSKECANKLKSSYMSGEKNHQFGLKGDLNASFLGKEIQTTGGYIMEYCPGHPYANEYGRVRQHRLVIERNHELFSEDYFEVINGNYYLKAEYHVHHKNENTQDNSIENLQIVTKSEHTHIHNLEKEIIRDSLGRITGVVKSGKIGESCDANTEVISGITKGPETP